MSWIHGLETAGSLERSDFLLAVSEWFGDVRPAMVTACLETLRARPRPGAAFVEHLLARLSGRYSVDVEEFLVDAPLSSSAAYFLAASSLLEHLEAASLSRGCLGNLIVQLKHPSRRVRERAARLTVGATPAVAGQGLLNAGYAA